MDDRFELVERAGAGGMGEVFRAWDRILGEVVAVKILHDVYAQDTARFRREGGILAQISHPRVVRYMAQGLSPSGAPYLVMEWLAGEDLGARLQRGPLTVEETLTLMEGVSEALAGVHSSGIVHRDLKPTNLFLVNGDLGMVKLLDFGIARLPETTRMTRSGTILGTPAYMAPEQARSGHAIDARADVFALGCVLFECLTGSMAFSGVHLMDVLVKIVLEDVPRVREISPEVPRWLDDLCARMLAKHPDARPSDGAAVLAAIRSSGQGVMIHGADEPERRSLTRNERRVQSIVLIGQDPRPAHDATTAIAAVPERMRAIAVARGAGLDLLADGSIMATFAGAGLATDQAAQAALCALSLRGLVGGRPMALATGRAELGDRRPASDLIERAIGALDRAAPAVCDPDWRRHAIALDEVTAGLLDARFDVAEISEGLWLRGEHVIAADARTLLGKPTACVGRDWEISSLDALLAECMDESRARAVLMTGLPGMGKTRVGAELLRRIGQRGQGVEVWIGRGDPLRAGAPLGMLHQALRGAVGIRDGDSPELSIDKLRERVGNCISGPDAHRVAAFLGEVVGTPFPDESNVQLRAARGDARIMGDQMRRAWVDFLGAVCASKPVLLVLEDLHWGDLPTVQYIDEALRALEHRPWMVLALARPEVHKRFPGLWSGRDIQELRLNSLSAKASARLVRQALGVAFDSETLERLVAQANGNAFYLEELIRAAAAGRTDAFPETVLAMVQSRLEGLDEPQRRLLRAASVFGDAFWRGALDALVGGADAPSIDEHLGRLEEQEWIVTRAESRFQGERELCFRHDLVREAAYGMLTEYDRALGHRLAGAWLDRAAETSAAVIAEHFDRAGEPKRAIDFYRRATDQAIAAKDFGAALSWTERALRLTERLAIAERAAVLSELLRLRGAVAIIMSRFAEAISLYRRALEAAKAAGNPYEELAACNGLVNAMIQAHHLKGLDAAAQEALALAGRTSHRALRLETLTALANLDIYTGDLVRASSFLDEVIATAEEMGDVRALVTPLIERSEIYCHQAEYARAEALATRGIALAEEIGDGFASLYGRFMLALATGNLGKVTAALAALDEIVKIGGRNGDTFWVARVPNCIGWIHREMQDFTHAAEQDNRGFAEGKVHGIGEAQANSLVNLALDSLHCPVGITPVEALDEARRLAETEPWMSWRYSIRIEAAAAEHWLGRGDLDRAEAHARRALAAASRCLARKYVATARWLLAEAAARRGDLAAARAELVVGVDVLRAYPVPLIVWKILAALGHVCAAAGDEDAAREAFAEAARTIEDIARNIGDERLRATFLNSSPARVVHRALASSPR
ncbi:protein kinase [Sorangium sp. So ce367]|uniref:serine/threonine-protein kinase n=1 Tax=Sorangium sp. So ce367 TaxID=3133305 RepID=UPI003F63FDAE